MECKLYTDLKMKKTCVWKSIFEMDSQHHWFYLQVIFVCTDQKRKLWGVLENRRYVRKIKMQAVHKVTNYCEGVEYENSDKFVLIFSIIGSFHIEMSFMSAIYKRLYKGIKYSGLACRGWSNSLRFSCLSLRWQSL